MWYFARSLGTLQACSFRIITAHAFHHSEANNAAKEQQ